MTGKARALVVADSDSYLKWGARRAVERADRDETDGVVVRSATTPSAQQGADALAGTHWHASETSAAALVDALVADPPEVPPGAPAALLAAAAAAGRLGNSIATTIT